MTEINIKELLRYNKRTYLKLIKNLRLSYNIIPFCEIPRASAENQISYLILRHDVDTSIPQALEMARIEKNIGLRSTYFILVSSNHYNVLEGENALMIKQISNLGHEIGLHYDVSQYRYYIHEPLQAARMEIQVLESILGKKIKSISSHAPSGPDSFIQIDGYINADDRKLRDSYVHDSRRIWTIRSLSKLLDTHPPKVQLLIHPSIWIPEKSRKETILDLFLLGILILLYRLRTVIIRIIHSQESVEN